MNTLQLQFLILIFAGWVNRDHQDVIEYLQEENRGLREQLGERHLRKAVKESTEHCHLERNHQCRGNDLIEKPSDEPNMDGAVECQERLRGVFKYYYRRAA